MSTTTTTTPLLTHDQIVWKEGRDAAKKRAKKKDNPYAQGSSDHRAWSKGFKGD
ncbi:hypothetical protein [Aureimonas populi]|uniref:DUF3941 domain-containing protein n=1 Tax=Aureimonas populi TaxID=1701758 RepID=A0ABW5CK36_9HYPH|nr:hypothetical protein [Aureimonas populi]